MSIASKLLNILNIKDAIKKAIQTKGGSINDQTPFADYAPKILSLPNQPDPFSIVFSLDNVGYPASLKMGSSTTRVPKKIAFESLIRTVEFSQKIVVIETDAFTSSFLERVEFPKSLTTIGSGAFKSCTKLTSLTLNEGLQVIRSNAFEGCNRIRGGITLHKLVIRLDYACFSGCSYLEGVEILSDNLEIESNVFYGCSAIKNVSFSNGVKTIASYAFYGCSSLKSIEIPDSVTLIGSYCFQNCVSATTLKLSQNISVINASAFMGCSNLLYINIPDAITVIYSSAFQNCNKVKQIDIGIGLLQVNALCFGNCVAVEVIRCYAVNPPQAMTTNIFNVLLTNIKLYVPDESVNLYKASSYWSYFNVLPMSEYVDLGYVVT